MFKFDWSRFDAKLGLIFMIGVLVVFNLTGRLELDLLAAGISALLAWLTILLVPRQRRSRHLLGLVAYLAVGSALTWLAAIVAPHPWARLLAMAAVTFAGYLMLLRGAHAFMVAWCLVYWYLLAPLFLGDQSPGGVVLAHVVGVALVIFLNLLKPIWSHATGEADPEVGSGEAAPSADFVVRYALIVSASVVAGVAAGTRWLTSDPTLIANATLNVISPSLRQTWQMAAERVVLGTLGILGGFYLGWFFPASWVGHVVTAGGAFLTLGVTRVNFGLVIGLLFFLLSYPWGAMRSGAGHLIANEKLVGELFGVLVALGAVSVLARLQSGSASSATRP